MKPEHEIYVDGAMSISLRSGVAKIDFYQALGMIDGNEGQEQKEIRKVSQRFVMPVAGLFELNGILEKVLKAIKDSDTS
ncbi:hypothetical protein CVPH_0343 [Abyssogena phaseoliformis symbiont OG214]|uniref:hypothetical protein n=1 Tax=Abyssogena phaseoliformis symbiont TaxID=596095 RepID=UPI001916C120|nr:hypothetical protein [Abyssogena phaseoliformis symbiont]MBW5289062.1 hypothetical protein [Candidatus Ruthia sp. Apha_13_S6]BBB22469.1 hypothetical protein CVPH_0343 [Abyssogena phaseoliformis symbiont OG214]